MEPRLSPACQNCHAAVIADVSNTGSVCTFEPHPLSGLLIGPQITQKYWKHAKVLTGDNLEEIGAYRDLDRKWMSLDQNISNTGGRIVAHCSTRKL
jgi:hypothetical protein